MTDKSYYVYILTSISRRLYVGCTSDLRRRILQHRQGLGPAHTRLYRIDRLVWWDTVRSKREALEAERRLKDFNRLKKVRLIEAQNAGWLDLSDDWLRSGGR